MPTQFEIAKLTREILAESKSDLWLSAVESIGNDQGEELWDIGVWCPRCEDRVIILTQSPKGVSPESQIRQKIQGHLATH